MRHLATTPDKDATTIHLAKSDDELRARILFDLFGKTNLSNLRFNDLTLPTHPGNALSEKKLSSLSEKYFSIPAKYLIYYPKSEAIIAKVMNKGKTGIKQKRKRESDVSRKVKRRVGRPKKVPVKIPGLQSVTKFFRPIHKDRSLT